MKSIKLLPNKCKPFGWLFLIIGLVGGIFLIAVDYETRFLRTNVLAIFHHSFVNDNLSFLTVIENSIVDELVGLCIIFGGLLVSFSKEKIEDEFIQKLRTDSLIWAIIINYSILAFTILFVYDFDFFDVLVFNMFTPLLFFILRFNYLKSKS